MAKEKKSAIKPEAIKMSAAPQTQEIDDADMPRPETKSYIKYLKTTPKFQQLFRNCVNTLPYNTMVQQPDSSKIRLLDLVRFVESKFNKCTVDEMNTILAIIGGLDFGHARPLMEVVEDKEQQVTLWSVFEE